MLNLKDYRVFVSSTSMDLQEQREAAFRAITRLELIPVVMEGFGAHTHSPIEVCRSKVGECRYFVLIVGFMYGSTYEDGKSFTEHEYECAVEADAKIKVFMMSDDAVVRGAFIEKGAGAEKLEAFKRRLRTNHTVQYFETADQLGALIKDTLSEELRKRDHDEERHEKGTRGRGEHDRGHGEGNDEGRGGEWTSGGGDAPRRAIDSREQLGTSIERVLLAAGVKTGAELATAWVGKVLADADVRWNERGYPKLKAMLQDFDVENGGFFRFRDVIQNGGKQTLVTYVGRRAGRKASRPAPAPAKVDRDGPLGRAVSAACEAALRSPEYAEPAALPDDAPESVSASVNVPQNMRARLASLLRGLDEKDVPELVETAWALARERGAVRRDGERLLFPVPVSTDVASLGYVELTIMPSVKGELEAKEWYKPWFVCFVSMRVVAVGEASGVARTKAFRPIDALGRFSDFSRVAETLLDQLVELALDEQWSWFAPSVGRRRVILENYLRATFARLAWEDGLVRRGRAGAPAKGATFDEGFAGGAHVCLSSDGTFAAFNTGLISESFNDIFACLRRAGGFGVFSCVGFCTVERSDLSRELIRKIPRLPLRARYFTKIGELLYDPERTLVPNVEHILVGNLERLPVAFLRRELGGLPGLAELFDSAERDGSQRGVLLARLRQTITADRMALESLENGFRTAVERSKKLVEWDYKMAVPSYYPAKNRMNFLLPLCLSNPHTADAALVVELLESGNYEGQTILTLSQAYIDARCIARPASEWLRPPR